jgi:single-strand DNA-binding protein
MADTHVTLVGNLTDDPEVRFTPAGTQVGSFRLAVTPRIREGDQWKNGETSYFTVTCWRDLASHAAESLAKGDRAVVIGRLKTRAWETPEGERRSVVEVEAEEVGPSLRWATATPQRAAKTKTSGQFNDDPPR